MIKSEIIYDCGQWYINGYGIAGDDESGYTVWNAGKGEDSDTLLESTSFEVCVMWCMNILGNKEERNGNK